MAPIRKPVFSLPGHNYLGPGNLAVGEGNSNKPVDSDDFIAAVHDEAYLNAKTKEDVYSADREAISQFASDALHNQNWHSIVGAAGLGVKHGVEKLTGSVFYPRLGK